MLGTSTALIIAHPGHELLLHRILETWRPIVFVLTDGSGGHGDTRLDFSRRAIEATGSTVGEVFGPAPDRVWYEAVLRGDPRPFLEARDAIIASCRERGVARLIADPVEFFNPMHDLAAAVAGAVARGLGGSIPVFDYSIEAARAEDPQDICIPLDEASLGRKLAAAWAYTPLAAEVGAYARSPALGLERLRAVDPAQEWPERLEREPFYETFGRRRLEEGAYDRLITYSGHVRPIAAALVAGLSLSGVRDCTSPRYSPSETNAPISATA